MTSVYVRESNGAVTMGKVYDMQKNAVMKPVSLYNVQRTSPLVRTGTC